MSAPCPTPQTAREPRPRAPLRPARKLLLLDPDERASAPLRADLEQIEEAAEIAYAGTPEEVLERLERDDYDCILIDDTDGNGTDRVCDGVAALRKLRDCGADVAAIVVSDRGDDGVAAEAIKSGAQDYVAREAATPEALALAISNAVEKVDLERRLRDKRRELEDFVSVVAHDLQQPLCAVKGNIELIRDYYDGRLDDQGREFVCSAIQTADRMFDMLQALLVYSRVGRASNPLGPVDTGVCIESALSNLSNLVEGAGARTHVEGELPTVRGDDLSLLQLFQNLIANAIKFHEGRPPEVRISARAEDGGWRISVADRGIGIDPQHFDEIFSPFRRLHSSKRFKGAGVGLATCQRIVEYHEGRIWVDSALGEGSTFHVWLPAAKAKPREPEERCEGAVLLVDDDLSALGSLPSQLKSAGFDVVATADSVQAAQAVEDREWSAVVTDLLMPRVSGAELIEKVRQRHPGALVVAVSGGGPRDSPGRLLAEARRIGADRLYPKPVQATTLLAAIQSAALNGRCSPSARAR